MSLFALVALGLLGAAAAEVAPQDFIMTHDEAQEILDMPLEFETATEEAKARAKTAGAAAKRDREREAASAASDEALPAPEGVASRGTAEPEEEAASLSDGAGDSDVAPAFSEGKTKKRRRHRPYIDDDGGTNYGNCGSLSFVTMCNGTRNQMTEVCIQVNGVQTCFRGICVCRGSDGCTEPVCSDSCGQANSGAQCADGRSCISSPGTGWSCWHPCNFNHAASEYGQGSDQDVDLLRRNGACAPWDPAIPPDAVEKDMPLDAGLHLSYQTFPVLGGSAYVEDFARPSSLLHLGAGLAVVVAMLRHWAA